MDGIHDLGGMQGFGPVPVTSDQHFRDFEDWEKRVWALNCAGVATSITIDWFRHGIELMVPADYLTFAYFNRWCTDYIMLMVDEGSVTMDEVRRGHVDEPRPPVEPVTVDGVLAINSKRNRSFETEAAGDPAFTAGAVIRTHRHGSRGHSRLPRYARDASGTVIAHRGCHLLPDEGARGNHVGQHLYTVEFAATELWGPDANPRDTVTLDLWESYLVPA